MDNKLKSFVINPRTNRQATNAELLEMQKEGYPIPEDNLPVILPTPETQAPSPNPINNTINANASGNAVEQIFSKFGNPFAGSGNAIISGAKSVGEGLQNLGSYTGEGLRNLGNYAGKGIDYVKSGVSDTLEDTGNWAYRNRVGLGGLATAIGAGIARRDPSEALARFNQSIIANKQQEMREEEFRMLKDPSHPYNQQFRSIFKQLIPDVALKLGDNFDKMTMQNFKDAGLTDLLDVTQKRITISMADPTSVISQRARDMAKSKYNIDVPNDISANQVQAFIDAEKYSTEKLFKEREVKAKETTAEAAAQKAKTNQQELGIKEKDEKRREEIFPIEKAIKEAEKNRINFQNKIQETNKQELINKPKLENEFLSKKIKDIDNNYNLGLKKLEVQERMANKQIGSAKDRLLARINFDKQKLRDELKYKYDALAQKDKLENLKLSYQNPEGTVNKKILESAGLNTQALKQLVDYSSDSETLKKYMSDLKYIIEKKGRYKAYSDQAIRGEIQALHTQIAGKIKDKDKLGALDEGVLKFVNNLITNPAEISNVFSNSTKIVSQLDTAMNDVSVEQRNKYKFSKWDPRMARDIGSFQKLVKKAYDGDKSSVLKFKQYGYSPEEIGEFYENKLPVIGGDEE